MTGTWQMWALLSAAFAALTAIFAKVGVENINSDLATFIRTIVILIVLGTILLALGEFQPLRSITGRTWLFLCLSGLATGRVLDLLFPRPQARQCVAGRADRQAERGAGRGLRRGVSRRTAERHELARRGADRRRGHPRRLQGLTA